MNERKRQEAIFELINTEVAYVRDLQLIVEVRFPCILLGTSRSTDLSNTGLLLEYAGRPVTEGDYRGLCKHRGHPSDKYCA